MKPVCYHNAECCFSDDVILQEFLAGSQNVMAKHWASPASTTISAKMGKLLKSFEPQFLDL